MGWINKKNTKHLLHIDMCCSWLYLLTILHVRDAHVMSLMYLKHLNCQKFLAVKEFYFEPFALNNGHSCHTT